MQKLLTSLSILLLILALSPLSKALEFNAITVFGCVEDGTQIRDARWNTGPADACWDIFMYQSDMVKSVNQAKWMNDPVSRMVKFTPSDESTTYTFHIECTSDINIFGLNLFVAGKNIPVMSVYAPVTRDAGKPAEFKVNHSDNTMSWPKGCWPMGSVPAAGTLSYDGIERSLWTHNYTFGGNLSYFYFKDSNRST